MITKGRASGKTKNQPTFLVFLHKPNIILKNPMLSAIVNVETSFCRKLIPMGQNPFDVKMHKLRVMFLNDVVHLNTGQHLPIYL